MGSRSIAMLSVIGCCTLSLFSGAAFAQNNITFNNDNGSTNVGVSYYLGGKHYTENTAAGSYNFTIAGKSYKGYCTDLSDNIHNSESWKATFTTVANPVSGLASTWYAKEVKLTTSNINAIDYLASHYINTSNSAAAQIAIWDLSLNSAVAKSGSSYNWGTAFSATGVSAQSVYSVEQAALANDGRSWGSILAYAGPQASGRPQDIAFGNYSSPNGPPPVPEASSMAGLSVLFGIGSLGMFRRRKR